MRHRKTAGALVALTLLAAGSLAQAQGFDPNGDIDGDGIRNSQDSDRDGDGILNRSDPNPNVFNRTYHVRNARDMDGDGIIDRDDRDRDGDGVPNARDADPDNPAIGRYARRDEDRYGDRDRYDRDGHRSRYERDMDRDGIPDHRDRDRDGDGVANWNDDFPNNPYRS